MNKKTKAVCWCAAMAVAMCAGCANTETRPFVTVCSDWSEPKGDSTNELKVVASLVEDYLYTYCVTNGGAKIIGPAQTIELRGRHMGARFIRAVLPAPTEVFAIPAFLNGYPVTSIGEFAFASSTKVKSITIPEGVMSIDFFAFFRCDQLRNVTIPSTVTNISYQAFGSCRNLKSVTILSDVATVKDYAFGDCTSLKSAVIPKSVTVENGAFPEGCKVQRK